jgi:hypothetical protein
LDIGKAYIIDACGVPEMIDEFGMVAVFIQCFKL